MSHLRVSSIEDRRNGVRRGRPCNRTRVDGRRCIGLLVAVVMMASVHSARLASGQSAPPRPDVATTEPLARCNLQSLPAAPTPYAAAPAAHYTISPPEVDALANYERSPLGDWRIAPDVDRNDPWLRLLLAGRRRPLLIDIAIFIDGKPFRAAREAWIDELLAASRSDAAPNTAAARESDASESASTQPPSETNDAPARIVAMVQPQARTKRTIGERLLSYLSAAGQDVDRKEIRWLIAAWGSGPELLLLGPSLSWQRAGVAPLWIALDQDGDGTLSASEVEGAAARLRRADKDRDDVVSVKELKQLADRPAGFFASAGHPLLVVLERDTEWEKLAASLARGYGREIAKLAQPNQLLVAAADVTLRVDLATRDAQAAGVSLLAITHEVAKIDGAIRAADDTITLDWAGQTIEFSAAQSSAETDRVAATQTSIGAAIDGNPLLRVLDRDQDGRLTSRERQELGAFLVSLDGNHDAQLASDEIPVPIRVAVTLGPRVHDVLSAARSAASAMRPPETREPPEWFAGMDRNHDRDVSRAEFLGTSEQFLRFDVDRDRLLSVPEALALDDEQRDESQK